MDSPVKVCMCVCVCVYVLYVVQCSDVCTCSSFYSRFLKFMFIPKNIISNS